MLQVLPAQPWHQLLVIRSAPGAGKTSLMRALSADTLAWISRHPTVVKPTYEALCDFDAIGEEGPQLLGVRVNLKYDFLSLADVGGDAEHQQRILNRLLDARIVSALVRAALVVAGEPPERASAVQIKADPDNVRAVTALRRMGGPSGTQLLAACEVAENEILDVLDRLVVRGHTLPDGHQHVYALQALSGARIFVAARELRMLPVIMLDEGQSLSANQRSRLLTELSDRETTVARWVGVQSRAMADNELIGAGQAGRDYEIIELESFSRERTGRSFDASSPVQRMTPTRYRAMLIDIADKRGNLAVSRLGVGEESFSGFFPTEDDEELARKFETAADSLASELQALTLGSNRYIKWLNGAEQWRGRDRLARLAEIGVLIARDKARHQQELFFDEMALPQEEIGRRGDSSLREAAMLAVSNRFDLPYYHGTDALARLASSNIEQFLELSGDLFAHLQVRARTNKAVELDAATQDRIVRRASDRYWNQLDRLPDGFLIQRLIEKIADLAATEAAKPTIPYPPGVTGTALSMADQRRLIDPKQRARHPGADHLRRALASAIAHNVVWIELDYSVKGDRWMVIYLNRLLCPRFHLPLLLGGFRERKLRAMAEWLVDPSTFAEQGRLL
ncbi:hypothetical protein [Antrihabitans spumae]|uniref:DNA helicase n=1 Tax=Antrihabitans spumae TaxID=3373370 RepID=A0ABW7KN33_9NOCA